MGSNSFIFKDSQKILSSFMWGSFDGKYASKHVKMAVALPSATSWEIRIRAYIKKGRIGWLPMRHSVYW